MLTLAQLAFLIAASWTALIAKAKVNKGDKGQSEYLVISLSALALAIATLAQLTLDPEGSDAGTLLRILNNLAIYAAAPMLVTAVGAIAKNYPISRPAWGRWLLGLFALFELCRRMGYGEEYTLVLGICCLAGLLAALVWFKSRPIATPLLASLALFSAALASHYFVAAAIALLLSSAGLISLSLSLRNVPLQPQPQ